jgi:hypothetical protein
VRQAVRGSSAIAALPSTRGGDGSPITVSSDPGLRFRAVDAITDLAEELAVDPADGVGHLADVPGRGRLSRRTACGPGSA